MHREITAIERDGFDVRTLTVICEVPSKDFDLKEAIRKASLEYVLTPGGSKIYAYNCRCFNLADFSANVPNSICEKYGFTKLDDVYSENEIDWDEQFVSDEDIEEDDA